MREFQLFRYLSKWKYLIFVVSLLGGLAFYLYALRNQTYTANALIRYTNDEAAEGRTPNGALIDVNQIFTSKVITEVILDLHIRSNVEAIRSKCFVYPVISEEEAARKEALLDEGGEYVYYPTDYVVSYTANYSKGEEYAKRVLDSILKYYFNGYTEKYIDQTMLPNNAQNVTDDKYDYIERVELIENALNDMLYYIDGKRDIYPDYRAASTGYGFEDLYGIYNYMHENTIPYLYADTCNGKITKDRDILIKKYKNRIESNQLKIVNFANKLETLGTVIKSFSDKNVEGLQKFSSVDGSEGNGNFVLADVYDDRTNEDGVKVNIDRTTTYDELIYTYVDYAVAKRYSEIDVAYSTNILSIFEVGGVSSEDDKAKLDRDINKLISELNLIYTTTSKTVSEFNQYMAARAITALSDIKVEEGINIKLYLVLTIIVFFIIGCVGSVAIGRAGDIVDFYMYHDLKTGLPNRQRCDKQIDSYSRRPLPENMSCIAITLKSLRSLNETKGYIIGDAHLKHFSNLIKDSAQGFGFLGYNGAGQFICLFENCTFARAENFISHLKGTVKGYNENFQDSDKMDVTIAIAESSTDNIYDIRELVREVFTKMKNTTPQKPTETDNPPTKEEVEK